MANHARFLLVGAAWFLACSSPEGLRKGHQNGGAAGAGAAGIGGAAGNGGVAGNIGVAGAQQGDAGATGQAGTQGDAGATGQAGASGVAGATGVAGAGTAGAGTAGAGVAGAGVAGAGVAGAGTAGAGVAGAGTAGSGAAGAGTAGAGTAGAGTAGAGTAGATGQAGAGTAGAGPAIFSNYCSPVRWTATASAPNAADPPTKAIDGNVNSRYATAANQVPGQTFTIDFGGTVSLTQVVLDQSTNLADYPRGYDVGLSANGTTFTSVGAATPAAMAATFTVNFAAAQGRYLQIKQTGTAANWWSLDEVRVTCTVPGKPAGAIDPFDPVNWKATASKSGAMDPPDEAIDGDGSTRWSTGVDQVGGEVFNLDIGTAVAASQIWLDGGNADYPAAYKLEVSTNGTAYMQVATGAGATGMITKIVFPTQMVRYFRITQTGTLDKYWSIYAIFVKP
jgi:F5/8 type C domain